MLQKKKTRLYTWEGSWALRSEETELVWQTRIVYNQVDYIYSWLTNAVGLYCAFKALLHSFCNKLNDIECISCIGCVSDMCTCIHVCVRVNDKM